MTENISKFHFNKIVPTVPRVFFPLYESTVCRSVESNLSAIGCHSCILKLWRLFRATKLFFFNIVWLSLWYHSALSNILETKAVFHENCQNLRKWSKRGPFLPRGSSGHWISSPTNVGMSILSLITVSHSGFWLAWSL